MGYTNATVTVCIGTFLVTEKPRETKENDYNNNNQSNKKKTESDGKEKNNNYKTY